MTDLIGQQLGQYRILQKLGEGGMGTVFRARQESMGRDVAIKVLHSQPAQIDDFSARFEREVKICASLSHAHIIKVFDYGKHDTLPMTYLVMELLTGGSLSDLIRGGGLTLIHISRVLDQLGSALDYAHQKELVHRDLKPSNVLLDEAGNVYLSDFGLAKLRTENAALTQSGMVIGTWPYMSPEQWRGQALDGRADVYALGVMLYEMLSGRLPFRAETAESMLYQHLFEAPSPIRSLRPDLPAEIDAVLGLALAKDPTTRFGKASDLAAAFRSVASGGSGASAMSPLPSLTAPVTLSVDPAMSYAPTMVVTPSATPITLATATTMKQVALLEGHTVAVSCVLFSPDGKRLASADHNGQIQLWDVAERTQVGCLMAAENAVISRLVYSADGQRLAAGGQALVVRDERNWNRFGTASLWQVNSERETWRMPQSRYVQDVTAIGFDPSGHLILTGEGSDLWVWELTDEQQLLQRMQLTHSKPISAAAISPSGRLLATGEGSTVWLWDLGSDRKPRALNGHTDRVQKVIFSPDETRLLSIGRSIVTRAQSVRIWQVASGREMGELDGPVDLIRGAAFATDNGFIATGSENGLIHLWGVENGRVLHELTGHSGQVHSLAFSPSGTLLASGSYNTSVRLWGLA